jgi:maltooligosyltrehalose trehalohydrolase
MQATPRGDFTVDVPGVGAGVDYLYVIDGDHALPDPVSRWQPHGVHGPSRTVAADAFAWSDAAWSGLATMADHVIYELHVGTFTEAGTFDAIVPRLGALRALGITAIELMPVAEFPGDRNWGYDGVALYAPHGRYGGPEGLKRLVDAAHGHGLAVVLDVVYNHVGPEGNYLDRFGPYFTERYRTPWGRAVNYDGPGSDGVRRHVIDNARHWITEYHIDALRVDAVHGIYDLGARHVLAELTDVVRAQGAALGRTVHLIAESDQNDPRVVCPTDDGGLGFDAQWADDLHHALHVALTGETDGYYADFAGDVLHDALPTALATPFVYGGRYSPARDRVHGASAESVPRDRFVVCAQNHDQVGNRAAGDRLSTLVDEARRRFAAAVVLLSGYVPLLFMGEEYGETRPFPYFVSHSDPALVDAVRAGRRREFADFPWEAVPDPQDAATFRSAILDWERRERADGATMLAWYDELLTLRRGEPALRPGAADVRVRHEPHASSWTMTFTPHAPSARAVCVLFNGAPTAVTMPVPDGLPEDREWTPLHGVPAADQPTIALPAFGVAIFGATARATAVR